ncbi:Receptor protein kinase-like protein ZAR1 [Sesamum angolense]|uniref:Receptor protein kinase-like protein ZAR1 n=1 Tax=Sesamum angolense TaxID=2727404 RepID=A0AAE2BNZ2_9LAMI|nr:Receptor protein kinase-like protein ZAR1 [Sesamum angolense]
MRVFCVLGIEAAPEGNEKKEGYCDASSADYSHKKKVLTDYAVIGIPGDGRCLFRSVAHGACIRSGKPVPSENLQRELADELRARVADEFMRDGKKQNGQFTQISLFLTFLFELFVHRFIEGDFDTYISQIRKPHVWGGEPELLMASHVLQMPITVYMLDQESGGLISIAEYGQEYDKGQSYSSPLPRLRFTFKTFIIHLPPSAVVFTPYVPFPSCVSPAMHDKSELRWSLTLSSQSSHCRRPKTRSCFLVRGPLPYDITTLQNLVHLDISSNNFNGSLPENLSNLTHLTGTLNLSYNAFSGEVPPSFGQFPVMVSLDLRHNNLTGKIPQQSMYSPAEAQNPRFLNNPENPGISSKGLMENRKIKGGLMAVSVVFGVSLVVGMVFASVWVVKRKWKMEEAKTVRENAVTEAAGGEEGQKGKFVVVDEGFGLELEDLLRASAYVLGKSRSGIVYKVVVSGGKGVGGPEVVAVRRLSEAEGDATWRFKEFEAEVEAIGRVQHPNIVRLRACYYASDEKLLVSDFISNGSLHNALHGLNSPPLSWAVRLRIAQEAAKGLMHIHECSNRKYTHGNIRSSKILLDDDLKPYISGFGLSRLVLGTSKSTNSASRKQKPSQTIVGSKSSTSSTVMYVAPEAREAGSRFTQKCDVYSFGIVLLEILTGRLPDGGLDNDGKGLEGVVRKVFLEEKPLSEVIDPALLHEVHAKKQVVATFHVALSCTELDPEQRPRMRTNFVLASYDVSFKSTPKNSST